MIHGPTSKTTPGVGPTLIAGGGGGGGGFLSTPLDPCLLDVSDIFNENNS